MSVQITVTVVNGVLSFSTSSKTVYEDDQLQWMCDHDAAFSFKRSPFKTGEKYGSAPANTAIGPFPVKKKSLIPSKNKYKYTFIAWVGGSAPIIMEDPQVIIDDHGGGPSPAKKKAKKTKPAKKAKKVSRKAKK